MRQQFLSLNLECKRRITRRLNIGYSRFVVMRTRRIITRGNLSSFLDPREHSGMSTQRHYLRNLEN